MKVAGLFAGIGGLERGLERAGHDTVALCEILPTARAVLSEHFSDSELIEDVRKVRDLPRVDLVSLGFPCQDLSQAGTTRGLSGHKSGTVKHVFRLLRRRAVPWLVIENVPFMLRLDGGAAMRYLTGQLERLGYQWAYRVVDARAFGLPHRRERVFLVAALSADPARVLFKDSMIPRIPTDYTGLACGFYWTEGNTGLGWAVDAVPPLKGGSGLGIPSPPAIWLPSGNFRIVTPDIRDAERLQGFPIGWTEPTTRVASHRFRWTLIGNAVSVPVAEWVGRAIRQPPGELPQERNPFLITDGWPKAAHGGPKSQRFAVQCSTWPVSRPAIPLQDFMEFKGVPLSYKATAGFYDRLKRSTLNRPPAFERDLEAHISGMSLLKGRAQSVREPRKASIHRRVSA